MANSKCIKCDSYDFEMVEKTIKNARYKFSLIQCSSCGGVVGAFEGTSIVDMIAEQNKVLIDMAKKMDVRVRGRLGFE